MADTCTTGRQEGGAGQAVVIARVVEPHRGTSYWTPPWGETPAATMEAAMSSPRGQLTRALDPAGSAAGMATAKAQA